MGAGSSHGGGGGDGTVEGGLQGSQFGIGLAGAGAFDGGGHCTVRDV